MLSTVVQTLQGLITEGIKFSSIVRVDGHININVDIFDDYAYTLDERISKTHGGEISLTSNSHFSKHVNNAQTNNSIREVNPNSEDKPLNQSDNAQAVNNSSNLVYSKDLLSIENDDNGDNFSSYDFNDEPDTKPVVPGKGSYLGKYGKKCNEIQQLLNLI